jgi:hypothetical protein
MLQDMKQKICLHLMFFQDAKLTGLPEEIRF